MGDAPLTEDDASRPSADPRAAAGDQRHTVSRRKLMPTANARRLVAAILVSTMSLAAALVVADAPPSREGEATTEVITGTLQAALGQPMVYVQVRDGKRVLVPCKSVGWWAERTVVEDAGHGPRFRLLTPTERSCGAKSAPRAPNCPKDETRVSGPSVREVV